MAVPQLYQGVLIRQVLSRKRKVRLEFIPDDTSKSPESAIRLYDDGEKRAWSYLLGNPRGIDIDSGITVLRFNRDNESGVALFMPESSTSPTITKMFRQRGTPGEGPVATLDQFNDCMAGKRSAVAPSQFNFWAAFSECAPLLRRSG